MEIDELVASLADSASVHGAGVYSASSPHPRFAQYKSSAWVKNSQDKRRSEMLERQKKNRDELLQGLRGVPDIVDDDAKAVRDLQRLRREFNDELMLSEWLVDVPQDFEANWLMVPVPMGKRCLVVASKGLTRCYSKTGYQICEFLSPLPGGSNRRGETKLDGILAKDSTIYVLDGIYLKNQSIGQGERNFRYFMLQSLFEETAESPDTSNKYKFVLLPQFACDSKSIEDAMNSDFKFELDGLLFYCNDAFYEPGLTPLVGWLKPFMLQEILGVKNLPAKYAPPVSQSADHHVTTAVEFIEDFNANLKKRSEKPLREKLSPKEATVSADLEEPAQEIEIDKASIV